MFTPDSDVLEHSWSLCYSRDLSTAGPGCDLYGELSAFLIDHLLPASFSPDHLLVHSVCFLVPVFACCRVTVLRLSLSRRPSLLYTLVNYSRISI